MSRPVSAARVGTWLAGVFLLCFVFFLPRWSLWDAVSHFDTTLAIVNHGTVAIDPYHWNNQDEDYLNGHYYSNKPPGLSVLAVPVYAVHKALFELAGNHQLSGSTGLPTNSLEQYLRFVLAEYLATVYLVAVPSVLLLLLFFWFLGFFSGSLFNRAALTLALGLGTSVFPYSQNFSAHVPTAALLFGGFVLLYILGEHPAPTPLGLRKYRYRADARGFTVGTVARGYPSTDGCSLSSSAEAGTRRTDTEAGARQGRAGSLPDHSRALPTSLTSEWERGTGRATSWLRGHERATATVAGLALGLAVTVSYEAAAISALLAGYAALRLPRRSLPFIALGAIPCAVALLGYNFAVYHNPLSTGYGGYSVPYWRRFSHGGTGSAWAFRPNALVGLAVGSSTGLFYLSPWLLLAFPGYYWWARRGDRHWILFLIIPAAFYLAISTFSGWQGGAEVGPRYLIPLLPFLAAPVIFVLDRAAAAWSRLVVYGSIAVSMAAVWAETLGGTTLLYPGQLPNPLFTYSLPQLAAGYLPLSLPTLLLHQISGPNALVTALPFAVILAAWSAALWMPVVTVRWSGLRRQLPGPTRS